MRRTRLIFGFVLIAVLCWWLFLRDHRVVDAPAAAQASDESSSMTSSRSSSQAQRDHRTGQIAWQAPDDKDGVTITGVVVDMESHAPVPGVEVVYRSALGETTAISVAGGSYTITVSRGVYRAFVRDDNVLSVGRPNLERLPGIPAVDSVGLPDEALMPLVIASADTQGIDLPVMRSATITGTIKDGAGHAIASAVIRTRGAEWRPALGSDIAETDASGVYTLRVPAGVVVLQAAHDRYAGIRAGTDDLQVELTAGAIEHRDFVLASGCVISGTVLGADGKLASDGAIERQFGLDGGKTQFGPAGQVSNDGTFRWATTEETEVTLRAWPWKSPPSQPRQFHCRDGARFTNIVFTLPNKGPDIDGILVDASGAGVPFGHIDLQPLDPGGMAQQERTDGEGKFSVFDLPSGHYRVVAHASGHGVVDTKIVSPQANVRLQLGGVGRLEGTTTELVDGSFELTLDTCGSDDGQVAIEHEQRLVSVIGGKFSVDDLPACELSFTAMWRGHPVDDTAKIPAGGSVHVELAVGPPHEKLVHGTVRDTEGKPVGNASVVSVSGDGESSDAVRSNASGSYAIKTYSGATIVASHDSEEGVGQVGHKNTDDEEVDITIGRNGDYDQTDEDNPS